MGPNALQRLLKSIEQFYPHVPVVIEDTGGNLSAGRNRAIGRAKTPYVMICEEDFEFTPKADLKALCSVLDHDAEIGGACGFVEQMKSGKNWYWQANMRRFRGTIEYSRPDDHRVTDDGIAYSICDLLPNAGVWRREVFDGCPWDEELEIQEHREWYWRLKTQERWRCAYVPSVSIQHHCDRPEGYREFRNRGQFGKLAEEKIGAKLGTFTGYPPVGDRPNIVVLGIGHANTSITTRQLFTLGWNAGDADAKFSESVSIREINERYLSGHGFDAEAAQHALSAIPQPWAIKDPRFSRGCFRQWLPAFTQYRPLLLYLTKSHDELIASYARRGYVVTRKRLEQMEADCQTIYDTWPWARVSVSAETIADAIRLFR